MGHYLSEMQSNERSEYIAPKTKTEFSFEEFLKQAPLKRRLLVTNEMMIQSHLIKIGVIPEGFWTDKKEKKYSKLWRKFAKELTKQQIEIFKEWEKDGRPK